MLFRAPMLSGTKILNININSTYKNKLNHRGGTGAYILLQISFISGRYSHVDQMKLRGLYFRSEEKYEGRSESNASYFFPWKLQ